MRKVLIAVALVSFAGTQVLAQETSQEAAAEPPAAPQQTPEGAHRFLATLAQQGALRVYLHYKAWPAFNLVYQISQVASEGPCRTVLRGAPVHVQLQNWPAYSAGTPMFAYGMKEFNERVQHKPPPWAISWDKITTLALSGPTASSPNDQLTVWTAGGNGAGLALRLPDAALAKRVHYAAQFLKEHCDKTAETGF